MGKYIQKGVRLQLYTRAEAGKSWKPGHRPSQFK